MHNNFSKMLEIKGYEVFRVDNYIFMTVRLPRSPFLARHFSEYGTNQAQAESVVHFRTICRGGQNLHRQ